jgi:hypothetical protein
MPIKDWLAGEQPSASDLNRYFMQQHHVVKSADESYSSGTTHDDSELFIPVQAGTNYWMTAMIIYEADGARDLEMRFVGPTDSSISYVSDSIPSTATTTSDIISRGLQVATSGPGVGGAGIGTAVVAIPKGILRVGVNSGTFRFRWAQLSGGSPATIVKANSVLTLRRLTT